MNEKIRKLLVEAREQTKEGRHHAPLNVWTEKFAELIVKECANVAYVHSEGSGMHDEGTLYYYLEDIAVKIKERFGVKE